VLRPRTCTVGEPGPGEVDPATGQVGVNYIDVYHRTGSRPATFLSVRSRQRRRGEVVAVGEGVTEFRPGDRAAYAMGIGSYAEERLIPAAISGQSCRTAFRTRPRAAMMLKGMTAAYLLRRTYNVRGRRHDPVPRGGRRRRPSRLPVGEAPRRHGDRHRRLGGQGAPRPRERL
jgi:NADPH2:quinone reductase